MIRDSLIVWALTAIGGFIAGLASGSDPDRLLLSLAISNLLFGTVGFTIAGYLAPADKWRHLRFVALGAWLTGLINVVFFGVSFTTWFFGAFFILLVMVTGGGLSCLLKNASAFQARRATLQDAPSPLPPSSVAAAPHSHQTNYAEHRLTDLKRLYEQGLITSDEYATKRQQILAGL